MPTTAAQPYFHQPSVTPISTATGNLLRGSRRAALGLVGRLAVEAVVLGMETTRTAIFSRPASSACAASASCTSEPVAMITAWAFSSGPRRWLGQHVGAAADVAQVALGA